MNPDAAEGYAIGYYYGRAIGSDEDGLKELEKRFGQHSAYEDYKYGFRYGYARGVVDFIDLDEEEDDDVELRIEGQSSDEPNGV